MAYLQTLFRTLNGAVQRLRRYQRTSIGVGAVLLLLSALWVTMVSLGWLAWLSDPIVDTIGACLLLLLAAIIATTVRGAIMSSRSVFERDGESLRLEREIANELREPASFAANEIEAIARHVYLQPGSNWVPPCLGKLNQTAKDVRDVGRKGPLSSSRWTNVARDLSRLQMFIAKVADGLIGSPPQNNDSTPSLSDLLASIGKIRDKVYLLLMRRDNTAIFSVVSWNFTFFVAFWTLYSLASTFVGQAYSDHNWLNFVLFLSAVAPVCVTLLHHLQHFVHRITDRTENQVDDLIVSLGLIPLTALLLLILLTRAYHLAPSSLIKTLDLFVGLLRDNLNGVVAPFVIVVIGAWAVTLIWRHAIIRALRRMAKITGQKHDDVFVEIIYWIGIYIIVAFSAGIFFTVVFRSYVNSIGDIWFPFTIVFSAGALILTYSIRETIGNFFSGILFQIDEPVKLGERLVLSTGEICDVRQFGMRSTTLYNVLENTEMSIPNKVLSEMILTNISRPDRQLRIHIDTFIAQPAGEAAEEDSQNGKASILRCAEAALVYVAYADEEVSYVTPKREDEATPEAGSDTHPDTSLTTLLVVLAARHPGEADAIKTALLSENSSLVAFSKIQKDLVAALNDAGGQLDLKRDNNIEHFLSLTDAFGRVSRDVYDLKERMPQLQDDMDEILNALAREPVVFSSFEISDEGRPYVRLSLNCFARFLERRYEVTNRLNRHIEAEFAKLGI